MCTIFIVSMAMGKGRLDSFLLLVLAHLCCLGQLLDHLLTNSNSSLLSFKTPSCFFKRKGILILFPCLLIQGSKESLCDVLYNLYTELHHKALAPI